MNSAFTELTRALSRRRLLAAGGVGAAGVVAAACGADGSPEAATSPSSAPSVEGTTAEPSPEATMADLSDVEKIVQFSNWPQYLDEDEGDGTTMQDFIDSSGIDVIYTDDINDSN